MKLTGGFSVDAESVIFTNKLIGTATNASAAALIGSATSDYAIGDSTLFALANGTNSLIYRFVSADGDGIVSAADLTELAVVVGVPSTQIGDYAFH